MTALWSSVLMVALSQAPQKNQLALYVIREALTPGCSADVDVSEEFTGPGAYARANAACEAQRKGRARSSYCAVRLGESRGSLQAVVVRIERDCQGWPGVVVQSIGIGFGADQEAARADALRELGNRDWSYSPARHKVEVIRGYSLVAPLQLTCRDDGGVVTFETRGRGDGGVPAVLIARGASNERVVINLRWLDGGLDAAALRDNISSQLCTPRESPSWHDWLLGNTKRLVDSGPADAGHRTKSGGFGVRD